MEKARTPLRVWLFLISLMANQGISLSVLGASRILGIPFDRAWRNCHKIRASMKERDASYRLAGFMEIDESYFGAKTSYCSYPQDRDHTSTMLFFELDQRSDRASRCHDGDICQEHVSSQGGGHHREASARPKCPTRQS